MVSRSLKQQHGGASHPSHDQRRQTLPLDDDDEEEEEKGQGTGEVLNVNEAYAKRLAHNKQRETQHRLEELKKRGVVDSSDEDDEDSDDYNFSDDGHIPSQTDAKIFETLARIKKKDPSIYSEDVRFFQDEDEDQDESEDEDDGEKRKSHKPIYLKDAVAKQLIEDGSDFDEDQPQRMKKGVVTYADEQQAIKDEFLHSVRLGDDEDGGFLKLRKREEPQVGDDVTEGLPYDKDIVQKLEEYFGNDDHLDENDKFLKEYLLKKSWVDEDANRIPSYEEIVGEVMEDEEELEKQDRFEADYNFRFEEGAGSHVMGHSRIVDDSVRRKDDARKLKREKKKERLSEAAFERREELKRLKNMKRKEILEKLQKIRNVAGMKESDEHLLEEQDLEEEFDPDEYDRKMREAFGEEYYVAEDADEKFQGFDMDDLEKPDFDAEDELLGLPKGWDEEDAGDKAGGFAAVHEKMKQSIEHGDEVDAGEQSEENNADEQSEDDRNLGNVEGMRSHSLSKRKKKGRISLREKLAFDKQLEEYYKLDYEDMVGDLPTRFKYRQVTPNMYGLSATEILAADDKDLNQYVSLKKISPYVTKEWKPKWRFQISQKLRKKKALKQQISSVKKAEHNGINQLNGGPDKEGFSSPGEQHEAFSGQVGSVVAEGSKKRKRRKKGLSLSESRLIAYGKISLPSKKKKKKKKKKQKQG